MIPADIRARTIAALARVIDDRDASPTDISRAGEALAKLDASKDLTDDVLELSDAALEAIARGEGGTPPERGPVTGVTGAGPIRAVERGSRGQPYSPGAGAKTEEIEDPLGLDEGGEFRADGTQIAGPSTGGPANSPSPAAISRRQRKPRQMGPK